jgi:uncharacterized protein (DUF302 family)
MTSQVTVTQKEFSGVRIQVNTTRSLDEVVANLRALMGRADGTRFAAVAQETNSEADYVREVEARLVGESGFMLFSEFDHGAWIGKFGIHRRVLRWILGNPLIAITMLRHDIGAGLFVPVEILLTEQLEEQGSTITYVRPSSLIAVEDNPQLLAAAQALDTKLHMLITRATNP